MVQIYRRFKWKCFEFSCPQFTRVHGKANFTLGIGLRRLTTCDEKDFWELKQEGVAQKILSWFPLMDDYPRPCYQVYLNNLKVGKSKSTHNSTQTLFTVNNDTFELFLHGDNYISVLKNDIQVALLRRDEKIIQETAIYSGHFSIKHISLSFLLLLVEYVDVTWFPMNGYASAKVSRTDISEDEPFKERVNWVPEDN